ncbi:MAG: T9SS type A sorting domain-containing protein [Sediminibacterium sp.]|nr:T9SS type A sorting domain-containing protein [Sediminibacterium sp.]
MKKSLLSVLFVAAGFCASAQSFNGLYPFTAITNTTGTTDPTTPPVATGVTFGAFTSAGVSANPNASGRFTFTGWGTGASTVALTIDTYSVYTGSLSPNQYYQVSVTPSANYSINYSQIRFDMRRSGTGVRNYAVRSSADAYTANLPASITPTNANLSVLPGDIFFWNFDATSTAADQKGSTISLSGTSFQNVTTPLSFRFYAWNAESNAGTFSIDTVVISGTANFTSGLKAYSHELNAGFKLYPNPGTGDVVNLEVLDTDYERIDIYDVLGKKVLSTWHTEESRIVLDVSELTAGTYLVSMKGKKGIYESKLIVTR